MKKLSQKWCIVSLLQEVAVGTQFDWRDWPLHTTLAPTFAIDHDAAWLSMFLDKFKDMGPLHTKAIKELSWKAESLRTIRVTQLDNVPSLQGLHDVIITELLESGAVFNEPQYIGPHYLPHVTVQKGASVEVGRDVIIDSISLVDMFPDGDGLQRKVIKTIFLR